LYFISAKATRTNILMPNGSTLKPYQKYHRKIIITTKAIKKNLARGGTSSKKKTFAAQPPKKSCAPCGNIHQKKPYRMFATK